MERIVVLACVGLLAIPNGVLAARPELLSVGVGGIGESGPVVHSLESLKNSPALLRTFKGTPSGRVTFCSDGTKFVGHDFPATVTFWDAKNGTRLSVGRELSDRLALAPSGQLLAVSGLDEGVEFLKIPELTRTARIRTNRQSVYSVAFSPDGKWLAGAVDSSVVIWDASTRQQVKATAIPGKRPMYAVLAFSPDGQMLATTLEGGKVVVWDTRTWKTRHELKLVQGNVVNTIVFSPDSGLIALGGTTYYYRSDAPLHGPHSVELWDTKTGKRLEPDGSSLTHSGGNGGGMALSFSPDGKLIAAHPDTADAIRVWDVQTRKLRLEFQPLPVIRDVTFLPKDLTLAVSGTTKESPDSVNVLQFWDIARLLHEKDREH